MWVLILIVTTGMYSVNLESIQGFTSERSCDTAGITVVNDLKTAFAKPKFVCVKQEG